MTNSTKFNFFRYQELLDKTNSSTKTGKEYFQDPEVLELLTLESSVQTQIFYDQKNEYFDLIQKYLDETMISSDFVAKFIKRTRENLKKSTEILENFEKLSTFWIEPGLTEFSSLFDEIDEACLTINEYGIGDQEISEDRFRNLIQTTFIKLKNRYP